MSQDIDDNEAHKVFIKKIYSSFSQAIDTVTDHLELQKHLEGYVLITLLRDPETGELTSLLAHGAMSGPTLLGHLEMAKADLVSHAIQQMPIKANNSKHLH